MAKYLKITALLLCAVGLIALTVIQFGGSSNVKDGEAYSIWLSVDGSGSFYESYNDNPVIRYITEFNTFNGKKINLQFKSTLASGINEVLTTKFATQDLEDVMDLSSATQTAVQLYEDGLILDLTDYVEAYMPNYLAYYEAHPEQKKYAVTLLDTDGDGVKEERFIHLNNISDQVKTPFMGYLYRRDWLVKYGTHPEGSPLAGQPFSGRWTEDGVWTDDIIFPSWYTPKGEAYRAHIDPDWDGSDPVFISDWEWMMGILQTALAGEGVADGYVTTIYYTGYNMCGDLVSSFGGSTNGHYYLGSDDLQHFGGADDDFMHYLECMHVWYSNGWLDPLYYTHTTDLMWEIDSTNTYAGKVGLFQGYMEISGKQLDNGGAGSLKDGMCLYPCRLPINDIYGEGTSACFEPGVNEFVPQTFFSEGLDGADYVVTIAAADKDLPTLFTFLDYLYSEEGGSLVEFGLSDEQIAQALDYPWGQSYAAANVTTMGTWNQEGKFEILEEVPSDFTGFRLLHLNPSSLNAGSKDQIRRKCASEWTVYPNIGYGDYMSYNSFYNADEAREYSTVYNNVTTYMARMVPPFISGEKSIGTDWVKFTKGLKMYKPETICDLCNKYSGQ